MSDTKPLTPKEIQFIEIYFENGFNATQAILSINPKVDQPSARTLGWRMLTKLNVREEIENRLRVWRAKRRMTVEDIGDLIQDFAQVDLLDIFTEEGDLKPLSEIPPHARRVIQSIEVEERYIGEEPTRIKKVKLVDKKGASELLGKYKKMFTDNLDLTSGGKPLAVSVSISGKTRKGTT